LVNWWLVKWWVVNGSTGSPSDSTSSLQAWATSKDWWVDNWWVDSAPPTAGKRRRINLDTQCSWIVIRGSSLLCTYALMRLFWHTGRVVRVYVAID
jgi:hypothetical protein